MVQQIMTAKRFTILLIALCTLAGAAVGGVASIPVAGPTTPTNMAGSTMSDAGDTNDSAARTSDCDVVDIDGNANTVSVNLTNNGSADDSNASVQLRCGIGNATTIDHDLIDIDGDDNTVRVTIASENGSVIIGNGTRTPGPSLGVALGCGGGDGFTDCDAVDIDGANNSVELVVRSDNGRTIYEFDASGTERGANDEDDDGDGHVDEDDEGSAGPSNDDDDGDGAIDEDDEPDDGDDGTDDFGGNAEDDDDGDGHVDEDDESDSGNSDDVDNDGDGATDEDDEASLPEANSTDD